jgi:hypothetical protein
MPFTLFERNSSGSRGSLRIPYIGVFSQGFRFNQLAKDKWLGDAEFVQIWVDRAEGKLAFKPSAGPDRGKYEHRAVIERLDREGPCHLRRPLDQVEVGGVLILC